MKQSIDVDAMAETSPAPGKGTGVVLTLFVLKHLIVLMGDQAKEDIDWSENVTAPETGDDFAREAIFVIANSGMRHTVAAGIFKRCLATLMSGTPVSEAFGHKGKAGAMETIWRDREQLLAGYLVAEDKLAFLEALPWIGPITKFHLAKNFGLNHAKPDLHLQRMAQRQGTTVQELCENLAQESGLRAATVDVILWRAAATGLIDSRTGRIGSLNPDGTEVQGEIGRAGLFTGLLDDASAERVDRLALAVDLECPATCRVCGCTDRRACPAGCYWVSVNRADRTGLCSFCMPES